MIELIASIASLLGVSATELLRFYNKKSKEARLWWTQEQKQREIDRRRDIIKSGLHISLLDKFYRDQRLCELGLTKYRFLVDDQAVVTSIIGQGPELRACIRVPSPASRSISFANHELISSPQLVPKLNPEEAVSDLAELDARGVHVYDRPLYRLESLSLQPNTWSAKFSLDSYLRWRLSLGILQDELFQGIIDSDNDIAAAVQQSERILPKRMQQLPPTSELFVAPDRRLAAGGPAMLCAFYRKETNDYFIPIKRRAPSMGSGAHMLGVVPQGFHQHSSAPADEVSLVLTAFREYYEELFGGREVENDTAHIAGDWFFDTAQPPLHWFTKSRKYRLYLTGAGTDPTSGTYDCPMLLVIDEPTYYRDFRSSMKFNWEFEGLVDHAYSPFVSSRDTEEIKRLLLLKDWAPSSLFSFIRGLIVLNNTSPTARVCLPSIQELV